MPEVKISAFPVSATETLQEAADQSSPSSTTSSRMADRAAHHRLSHDKILDQSQAGRRACNQSTCRVQWRRNLYLQNSFKITNSAQAMLPGCKMPEVGIREGEKLHEIMVTVEDSLNTYEYDKHFIVYPQMAWSESRRAVPTGKKVSESFSYSSGNNTQWLTVEEIKELLNTIELEK